MGILQPSTLSIHSGLAPTPCIFIFSSSLSPFQPPLPKGLNDNKIFTSSLIISLLEIHKIHTFPFHTLIHCVCIVAPSREQFPVGMWPPHVKCTAWNLKCSVSPKLQILSLIVNSLIVNVNYHFRAYFM